MGHITKAHAHKKVAGPLGWVDSGNGRKQLGIVTCSYADELACARNLSLGHTVPQCYWSEIVNT
jgi:hypothetical protein